MTILQEFHALRPAGGFAAILADPPWRFDNWSEAGEGKNPNQHYACQGTEWIAALPVSALAAKDCALFLWVTWPLMPQWMQVITAWGFSYGGLAWEWIKYNEDTGKYAFGAGYGTRKNLEPCLLCTRGEPKLRAPLSFFGVRGEGQSSHAVRDFLLAMPHDTIRAGRREHSRKPDEQYSRIELMFEGPYCELFSRANRKGWSAWGNQLGKFEAAE